MHILHRIDQLMTEHNCTEICDIKWVLLDRVTGLDRDGGMINRQCSRSWQTCPRTRETVNHTASQHVYSYTFVYTYTYTHRIQCAHCLMETGLDHGWVRLMARPASLGAPVLITTPLSQLEAASLTASLLIIITLQLRTQTMVCKARQNQL